MSEWVAGQAVLGVRVGLVIGARLSGEGIIVRFGGGVLIVTVQCVTGGLVSEEAEASLVFPLGYLVDGYGTVLILLVGIRDPRKQRCVARTLLQCTVSPSRVF